MLGIDSRYCTILRRPITVVLSLIAMVSGLLISSIGTASAGTIVITTQSLPTAALGSSYYATLSAAEGTPASGGAIAMARTFDGSGYWVVDSKGDVFTFGDAISYGSLTGTVQNYPIVGFSSTPDGKGYWMVGSNGGVFTFGDAGFYGSNSFVAKAPIIGIVPTSTGKGYWLLGSDGGIFAFGDAEFYGSSGQINPAQAGGGSNSFFPAAPIVGMIPSIDDKGYLMVGMDGGVYAFGDAPFYGSPAGSLSSPNSVTGIALTPDGKGYWVAGLDGSIYSFGDGTPTPILETTPGPTSSSNIIAIAAS